MGCDHKESGILWDDVDAFGFFGGGAYGIKYIRDYGGGGKVAVSTESNKETKHVGWTSATQAACAGPVWLKV